eukprot:gene11268-biopygen7750
MTRSEGRHCRESCDTSNQRKSCERGHGMVLPLWYVQTTGSRGLPPTLETHTFRIGAKYRGNTFSSHTLGVTAGTSGHYVLTTDPKEAHFGVYINARMDRYPNTARSTRQRRNSVKIDKAPETPRALRST